jgi:hypothetical protein
MRTEVNQTDILCVLRQGMSGARACQKLKKKSLILWATSLPVDLNYVDSLLTGVLEHRAKIALTLTQLKKQQEGS